MRIFCRVVRVIGVFVGLFFIATGLISIFGSMPGFNDITTSSTGRLLSGLPLLIFGILLLLPQSLFLRGKRYLFLFFSYVALIMAAFPFTILGVVAYYEGGIHWLIIPTSIVLLAVPTFNAIVLWYLGRHSRRRPYNSPKAKPLRGSA